MLLNPLRKRRKQTYMVQQKGIWQGAAEELSHSSGRCVVFVKKQ
jgi:hypothetical protein